MLKSRACRLQRPASEDDRASDDENADIAMPSGANVVADDTNTDEGPGAKAEAEDEMVVAPKPLLVTERLIRPLETEPPSLTA
jgi:hypothetical protein